MSNILNIDKELKHEIYNTHEMIYCEQYTSKYKRIAFVDILRLDN